MPQLVKGPCLFNVVWGGKSPKIDFAEAETMGYKVAIVPGLLIKAAMGASDEALAALREQGRHPTPGVGDDHQGGVCPRRRRRMGAAARALPRSVAQARGVSTLFPSG